MSFLSIESSNPLFSYIIQKNPENTVVKSIRQGYAIGWFNLKNIQEYCIVFKDKPQEMSYSNSEFEYLDVTALSSPASYSNLISNFFSGLLKKKNENDSEVEINIIHLGFIKCNKKVLEHFAKFFDEVSYMEKSNNIFEVTFQSTSYQGSLRRLLHLVNLFCIVMVASDEDFYLDINEDLVNKYMNSIKEIQCPYYVANMFKVRFLKTKVLFTKFSSQLQESCLENVTFEFGNTQQARKNFIENNITIKNNIVDLGCGEDFSYWYLSKNIDGVFYPIDKDENVRKSVIRKINRKELLNVTEPLNSWEEVKDLLESPTEVILSEVLEHNTLKEAKNLLKEVLLHPQVKKVLVTMPYKMFNKHYLISDNEFRHDDHKWELDIQIQLELEELFSKCGIERWGWTHIGDIIDESHGISLVTNSPTIGVVLEK